MDRNLQFITNKIADIQLALLHCSSNSLLKICSTIIHTYKVDDDGHILFFLPRPTQLISQFDKDFPVELNYFKKGVGESLRVEGKARIINDPEELHEYDLSIEEADRALTRDILVVVKILKASYRPGALANSQHAIQKMKSFVYSLLAWVEPGAKSYDFSNSRLPNYGF